jgi:DNA mismatch endonuclease (patch repair protein)
MSDVFTKAKRSEVMSRIRSRGNKETELALAKLLRANKITGWRRHGKLIVKKLMVESRTRRGKDNQRSTKNHQLAVRPDFVFSQVRLAVFVDGCFWHGCPRHATRPKNNFDFWHRKLSGNKKRDVLVNQTLRRTGWQVLRIWECDLQKRPQVCVSRILRALKWDERAATQSGSNSHPSP